MKKIFELRKNKRALAIHEKNATPIKTNGKYCPECAVCGALLPNDLAFQEAHMLQVHGLIV